MIELTADQRNELLQQQENPPQIYDSQSDITYVLLKRDVFERIRRVLDDDTTEDQWAAFLEAAGDEWDDPALDVYEQYRKR